MTNAAAVTVDALVIATLAGLELHLKPVPMSIRPSETPENWLKFQGAHVAGGQLTEVMQDKVQAYMRRHNTETLTDGERNLTLAGGGLAICFPEKFGVVASKASGSPDSVSSNTPMTHEIKLDGEFLIKGDEVSIRVLWKNLNGSNFKNPRPWNAEQTYENYLKMFEREWNCDLSAGCVLTLHLVGSAESLATHTIQL